MGWDPTDVLQFMELHVHVHTPLSVLIIYEHTQGDLGYILCVQRGIFQAHNLHLSFRK